MNGTLLCNFLPWWEKCLLETDGILSCNPISLVFVKLLSKTRYNTFTFTVLHPGSNNLCGANVIIIAYSCMVAVARWHHNYINKWNQSGFQSSIHMSVERPRVFLIFSDQTSLAIDLVTMFAWWALLACVGSYLTSLMLVILNYHGQSFSLLFNFNQSLHVFHPS